MSGWGRNDKAVTANSTTTKETSTGAPIGTYALVKGASVSMVANAHYGNTSAGSRASVDVALFSNVSPGAFIPGMATGVFGVSAIEMANNVTNGSANHPAHAGWVYRKAGTGPIVSAEITAGGTGYDNTDVITVASTQAGGNATLSVVTDASGVITAVSIEDPGAGFLAVDQTAALTIDTLSGTNAVIAVTAGGRAGRVHTETLVAMGSLGTNAVSTTGVYGATNTIADATSDNTYYPGR